MAKKNQAMLGDSIISKIDLHEDFLKVKTRTDKGLTVDVGFLDRIYTDRSGNEFRYKVRELNHTTYRDLLPFSASEKQLFSDSNSIGNPYLSFNCYVLEDNTKVEYQSVSRALPKSKSLSFKLVASKRLAETERLPLTAKFTKRNYGHEAKNKKGFGVFPKGEHPITFMRGPSESAFNQADVIEIPESTQYRGLHTMECEVTDSANKTIYRQTIGVFIE